LLLATKASDNIIHRLGIDFQTLEDFGIDIKVVQEEYASENNSHYKYLKEKAKKDPKLKIQLDYLKHHRVEIDSVLAETGNRKFWDYIIEKFPHRNYNRAITISAYVPPKTVDDFIANIQNKISKLQSEKRQKLMNKLENTKGFLDVNRKKAEIEATLRSIAEEKINKVTQFISDEIKKFSNLI
jgi:hypothetical protein